MMPGFPFRLFGGLLGLVALASAAWLIRDRFHQKALADAANACATAAADTADRASLDQCLPKIASEIREARAARLCEGTLLPSLRPETRFAMQQVCGAGVKRLVATADGALQERDNLASQLRDARADLGSAVERAERRSSNQARRTDHGQEVIQAAPRDPGGRIRCDAECLSRLGQ